MPLRSYDPTIARWNRIDPVTHHSLSTYNGFDNNPVFFSDPSGADAQSAHELYHNGAPARLNTRDFNGGRAHDYATRASTAAGGYEDNNKNGTRNYGNDLIGALNDLGVEYTIGGTDPESDPMFPFTSGVQGMEEVIITAPKNSGGFDENTPDWIRNMKVGSYETPFRGSLADYNRKYRTNYTSDNTYAQYYYQTSYKPQLSALRGSIQAAQGEAAGYIMDGATLLAPIPKIGLIRSLSRIPITSKIAFWSGKGTRAAAEGAGHLVISNRLSGTILNKLTAPLPYYPGSLSYKLWGGLSKFYAKRASGTVHVFQNAQFGTGINSIWAKYEYPALLKNPKVQNIIYHY